MTEPRVESTHIPYVPIIVSAGNSAATLMTEALVDTGFDGYVVVPRGSFPASGAARQYLRWTLAGGSSVSAPAYRGYLRIGSTELPGIVITELGDETIIGLAALRSFKLTLDHDVLLTVEP